MIRVAAGILHNAAGQYLVAQRPAGKHLAGLWEFPGGKLDAGETPVAALTRELQEELGIRVLAAQPLLSLQHHYSDRHIELQAMEVLRWQGEPQALEQQALQWVSYAELQALDMPAADTPILRALRLPGQYFITPEWHTSQADWRSLVQRAIINGAGMVQLRQPGMHPRALRDQAREVANCCHQHGAGLIINTNADSELPDCCDGLHLNSSHLNTTAATRCRERLGDRLLGASCHSADELQRAASIGCDYALLSPVKRTSSHTDARPLGWQRFAELAAGVNIPVFALGGLQPEDIDQARACGAIGVAGISRFL